MFKITPIQDLSEQKRFAVACGTDVKAGYFAYGMTDNESGDIMGFSQFELTKSYGYISDLRAAIGYDDVEALFILGRATMNFIDLCGVRACRAALDSSDEKLLHAIGFRKYDEGYMQCDLTGMFDGHCTGEKENKR